MSVSFNYLDWIIDYYQLSINPKNPHYDYTC
ncbi:hypothetical protein ZORO111903_19305 [Zobellia roscoffensis]